MEQPVQCRGWASASSESCAALLLHSFPYSMFAFFLYMSICLAFLSISFYTCSNHTVHKYIPTWGSSSEQGGRHVTLDTLGPSSVPSWSQCGCLYLRCWSPDTLLLWLQKIKESTRNMWFGTVSEDAKMRDRYLLHHCSVLVLLFENWFCNFRDWDWNIEMYLDFRKC